MNRRVAWMNAFSIKQQPQELASERLKYQKIKDGMEFDPRTIADDPLSCSEDNPWIQKYKDDDLRNVIQKDTSRIFPDLAQFRSLAIQTLLENVLFVWCKQHDVEYRQGMHEIVAVIYYVIEKSNSEALQGETAGNAHIFNSEFAEHDTFLLFQGLMHNLSKFFYSDFCLRSCNKIYTELESSDIELHRHLKLLQIESQLFGIRWLRLLFAREFNIDNVLYLWDAIVSDFEMCIWIAVQMLIAIRDCLIRAEYSMVMEHLMKYPADKIDFDNLVVNARKLRTNTGFHSQIQQAVDTLQEIQRNVDELNRRKIDEVCQNLRSIIPHIKQLETDDKLLKLQQPEQFVRSKQKSLSELMSNMMTKDPNPAQYIDREFTNLGK